MSYDGHMYSKITYSKICVQIVRLLNVQPLGDGINSSFTKFLDEQDQGPLVLTPIYLLVGSFLPLWLAPVTKNLGSLL